MSLSLLTVVVDCRDPRRGAEFWAKALDYAVSRRNPDEFQVSDPAGSGGSLYFMKVPEPKAGKNRLHLDLVTSGAMEDEVNRLIALGAQVVEVRQDPTSLDNPDTWTVMLDPEGNEFCVTSTTPLTNWAGVASTESRTKEEALSDNVETAVLSGGCFWTMQQLFRACNGVLATRVGWTGGKNDNPTEENNSGHAEAVEVVFDPERISYRELLEYFFQVHRSDLGESVVGPSYRSEIFYGNEEQRTVAEETIQDVDAAGHWPGKVVTRLSAACPFWEAADEDQDYFQCFPDGCAAPFPRRHVVAASRTTAV